MRYYTMIGTEACEELMAYIQEHGVNESDDAEALEAVYPSEQAVECNDIPYYSYREIVALLDESYLKEIPAAKG